MNDDGKQEGFTGLRTAELKIKKKTLMNYLYRRDTEGLFYQHI